MENVARIKEKCVGCKSCAQSCPKHCISMVESNEGFWYPSVDEKSCIECKLCLKKCPVENTEFHRNNPQKVWAWRNKNDTDIMRSASGGAADSAAKTVLQTGGVVYGAAYDEQLAVSHIEVTTDAEREKLQSSKYVQSDPKDSYAKAKQRLVEGKTVLFTGTPCQIAGLGIPTYGIRACAKVRDDREELSKMVQELLIINLVMSALSYAVYFAAIYYVPRFRQDKELFLIIGLTIFFNAIGMEWLYKALEQYTYITVRSIIFKFIAIVAMFLMVHEQSDYVIYGGISILASSASNIFNFFHIHRYINIKPVGHYNFKKHLKAIVVFFAMSCATTIYTHLDTVMLGFIRTDVDVGYYNAAVKIKTILVSIVTSLGVVLLPRASYYVEHNMMDEFYRITKKAINFVFLIATPMMVYFMLFAKEGVFFLSGDAYAGAIIPMQVIMPTLLFIGLTNIMGIQMLVPLGKEKVVLYSEIAGMIGDIILNALLIPKMASTGAAIGTLAAEIAVFIVQYVALRGIIKEAYRQVHYVAIGSSVLAGGVLAVLIKRMQWGSFMTLCASAIVFFGVYFLILTIAKESLVIEIENQLLGRIIKKK